MGTIRILEAIRASGIADALLSGVVLGDVRLRPASADGGNAVPPAQPLRSRKGLRLLVNGELPRGVRACSPATASCSTTRSPDAARPSSLARSPAAVARIKAGLQDRLYLGNLDAKRDWGYAPEYVEAMWLMLQQDEPGDFVIATGEAHTVREFVEAAFDHVGLDWERHVEIDPRYFRPAEVDELRGDPSRALEKLGWKARTTFSDLVALMVDSDVRLLEDELSGRMVRVDRDD